MLRNNKLSFQITGIWSAIGGPTLTENECNNIAWHTLDLFFPIEASITSFMRSSFYF